MSRDELPAGTPAVAGAPPDEAPTTEYDHGTTHAVKVATERQQAAALRAAGRDDLAAQHDRNVELYAAGPEDLGWSPKREPAVTILVNPFNAPKWDGKTRSTKTPEERAAFVAKAATRITADLERHAQRLRSKGSAFVSSPKIMRTVSTTRPVARARENRPSSVRVAVGAASNSRGDPSSSSDDDSGPERAPHRNGEARLDLDPHRGLEPLCTLSSRRWSR